MADCTGRDHVHDAPTLPFRGSRQAIPSSKDQIGAYRLIRSLGSGGFGDVWLAEHPLLGAVALKILRSNAEVDVRLFDREGRIVLDHDAIPRVLDHGEIDGARFLAQQYIEGRDLADIVREGPLSEERVTDIAIPIAEALSHAHDRGIVHRDLKPSNILVDDRDRAWVLDFGVARVKGSADEGEPMGSPAFMAPEQAMGRATSAAADLYSLGVVMYLMLTQRLPIEADTVLAMLGAVAISDPVPITTHRQAVTPALVDLVMRLLAKEPDERPSGAAQVIRELRAIRKGAGATGRFAEVHRTKEGTGGALLVTGVEREEVRSEILMAAEALGFTVLCGRGRVDGGPHEPLRDALRCDPQLPEAPTRGQVLGAWRRALRDLCANPLLLILDDMHRADDGTLQVIASLAPILPELPLLILLMAPSDGPELRPTIDRLRSFGVLARRVRGGEDRDESPHECSLTQDALLEQAGIAERLWARGLAQIRLDEWLQRAAPADTRRADVLARLGRLRRQRGERSDARGSLHEAAIIASRLGDDGILARVHRDLAIIAIDEARLDEAMALLMKARVAAERSGSLTERAACDNEMGLVHRLRHEPEEAERKFRRALAVWQSCGDAPRQAACLNNLAVVHAERGRMNDARHWQDAALAVWKAAGDEEGEATALVNLGNLDAEQGDYRAARRCYEEGARIARSCGAAELLGSALQNLAMVAGLSGEPEVAVEILREALDLSRKVGDRPGVSNCLESRGIMELRLHRPREAERSHREALTLRAETTDRYGQAMSLLNLGLVRHQEKRCPEALPFYSEAAALAESLERPHLVAQLLALSGRCRVELGDASGLPGLWDALRRADELGARAISCEARTYLAEALRDSDPDHALRLAREAVEMARDGALREAQVEAMRLWESLGGREGAR